MGDPHDRWRRGPPQPPLPKPYEFVPLGAKQLRRPAGHHRFNGLTGTLHAVLIARSPVHVASGLLESKNTGQYPLVKALFRSKERPTIPATSLKGCIRSILEAISPSAVGVSRARPLPPEAQPSFSPERLDVAQRLFGTLGYQGQVRFGDATLEAGETTTVPSVQLFRPRQDAAGTYFDGTRVKGRKFYMHGTPAKGDLPLEACPEGSRFPFQADFAGLTEGELGLLLLALGLGESEPAFYPKLGGAKPACLGTLEVAETRVEIISTRAAYQEFDIVPESREIGPLLAAAHAERLVLEPQLARLAEILRWPREDRNCPDRNY
jgi:hypothetical protein